MANSPSIGRPAALTPYSSAAANPEVRKGAKPTAPVDTLQDVRANEGASESVATPAPLRAPSAATVSTPGAAPALAIVSGVPITHETVLAASDTLDWQRYVQHQLLRDSGLTRGANESDEAFTTRALDAITAAGKLDAHTQRLQVAAEARYEATLALVIEVAVLRSFAPAPAPPQGTGESLGAYHARLRETIAPTGAAVAALERRLDEGVSTALWAPYAATMKAAFGNTDVIPALNAIYAPSHGLSTPARVAADLKGPLQTYALLVKVTGRADGWSVSELDNLRLARKEVAPLIDRAFAQVGIKDTFSDGESVIALAAGPKLSMVRAQPNPAVRDVAQGRLAFAWRKVEGAGEQYALAPALNEPKANTDQITALTARISDRLVWMFEQLDRFDYETIKRRSGLLAVLGSDMLDALFAAMPGVDDKLTLRLVTALASGAGRDDAIASVAATKLPASALAVTHDVPFVASLLASDPMPSTDAERGVWLQRQYVRLGVAHDQTTDEPRALDESLALEVVSIARSMPALRTFVGDMLLSHPAIAAHRARGGTLDAATLVLAYLRECGVPSQPVDAAFVRGLDKNFRLPIDPAALARAELKASAASAMPEADLWRLLGTKVTVFANALPVIEGQATAAEQRKLVQRIASKALPQQERAIQRSEAGFFPVHEPIVAIKLTLRKLRDESAHLVVGSDGVIDGTLSASELRQIRDWIRPTGAVLSAFNDVAQAVADGQLVLANLHEDLPSGPLAAKTNIVLAHLRAVAESIRVSTRAVTSASLAVADHDNAFPLLESLPRPLFSALALLRGSKLPETQTARVLASDVADPGLRTAINEQRLIIDEAGVRSTPRSAELEAQGRDLLQTLMRRAEAMQAARRTATASHSHKLAGIALEVRHNLGRIPGFADAVVANEVQNWRLLGLRLEMFRTGVGPDPTIGNAMPTPERKDATLVLAKPIRDEQDADARRAAVFGVDADVLLHLCDHLPQTLGASTTEMLIAGVPQKLPTQAHAEQSLRAIAARMKRGELSPWSSLSVLLGDDAETRNAKILVQVALARREHRDVDAVKTLVKRELAVEDECLAPLAKAMLVERGLVSARLVGAVDDDTFAPELLTAASGFAVSSAGILGGDQELMRAADVLFAAGQRGKRVKLSDDADCAKALAVVIEHTDVAYSAHGSLGTFDFAAMLRDTPRGADGALSVRSPAHNQVVEAGAVRDSLRSVGAPATKGASSGDAYLSRVRFDLARVVQTTIAQHVLFKYVMHSVISYDLSVVPAFGSLRAAKAYFAATNDAERAEAAAQFQNVVANLGTTLASFTAYPVGFVDDVAQDLREGELDVATGRLIVTAPMMYASVRGLLAMGRGAADYLRFKGKRFKVASVTIADVAPIHTTSGGGSKARVALARTVVGAKKLGSVILDPAGATLRELSAMKRTLLGAPRVKLSGAKPAPELVTFIATHQDAFVQVDLSGSGRLGAQRRTTVSLSARDLTSAASEYRATGRINASVAERLGLSGDAAKDMKEWLGGMIEELGKRPELAPSAPLSLKALAANAGGETTWQIRTATSQSSITLRHSTLTRLLKAYYHDGDFEAVLERFGLGHQATEVDLVMRSFAHESISEMLASDTTALLVDTRARIQAAFSRPKEAIVKAVKPQVMDDAGNLLVTAEPLENYVGTPAGAGKLLYTVRELRVIEAADGRLFVRSGTTDVTNTPRGARIVATIEAYNKRYGTTNGAQINALRKIESSRRQWATRLEGEPLSAAERANFDAFVSASKESFAHELSAAELATARGRLTMDLLSARCFAQELRVAMKEGGLSNATVAVVEGVGRSLRGQAKDPSFYLVVALGAKEFLIDVGGIANSSASTRDKLAAAVKAAALRGGEAGLGLLLFHLASRLAPRAAHGAGTIGLVHAVIHLDEIILQVASAFAGMSSSLASLGFWQQLGLPEARALKLSSGDRDQIARESDARLLSPRTHFLYFDPKSTLYARIRQLCGEPMNGDKIIKLWRPQDFAPERVSHYVEPVFPSTLALRNQADFDFGAWQNAVRAQAAGAMSEVDIEGKKHLLVDSVALLTLLTSQARLERYDATERAQITKRLAADTESVASMAALLAATRVPLAEQETALTQLIENLAANHRMNIIVRDYAKARSLALGAVDADDFYLYAPTLTELVKTP